MAFEIKESRKVDGELMEVSFDRKKCHYKSLKMVEVPLSDEGVWSGWKANKREAENKERERLARLKDASALKRRTGRLN